MSLGVLLSKFALNYICGVTNPGDHSTCRVQQLCEDQKCWIPQAEVAVWVRVGQSVVMRWFSLDQGRECTISRTSPQKGVQGCVCVLIAFLSVCMNIQEYILMNIWAYFFPIFIETNSPSDSHYSVGGRGKWLIHSVMQPVAFGANRQASILM